MGMGMGGNMVVGGSEDEGGRVGLDRMEVD